MSDKPKEYKIMTLQDLVNVPEDKMADCMVDLEAWVAYLRILKQMSVNMDIPPEIATPTLLPATAPLVRIPALIAPAPEISTAPSPSMATE